MKNKLLPWLLVTILIIIILLQRSCKTVPSNSPETITKIEWKYDTIKKEVPVYVPQWKTKTKYEIDTFVKIDTVKVLGDYYTKYFYSDTLADDSLNLVVNDTLFENKIYSREIDYRLIYPTKIITKEIYPQTRDFYIGGELVGNQQGVYYVGPKLIYKDKKNNGYGFGVGVGGDFKPVLNVGIYKKL